jgi:hypothetical protein
VIYSQTSTLAEPSGEDRVPDGNLAYFTARNRRKIYSAVIKEFKDSGLSQIQLAKRLGKRPEVICRWLSGPGNWGLDTVSLLLFGISGGELTYNVAHPLRQSPRNYNAPEWLNRPAVANTETSMVVTVDVNGKERQTTQSGTEYSPARYSILEDAR